MSKTDFTASGVSVAFDWTTIKAVSVGTSNAAHSISFALANDSGSTGTIVGVRLQVRPHASAGWYNIPGKENLIGIDENGRRLEQLEPKDVALYCVKLDSPSYDLRVQAHADGRAVTATMYGHTTSDSAAMEGGVAQSLFDAYTVLAAQSDNTPIPISVSADSLIGRAGSLDIDALNPSQVNSFLHPQWDWVAGEWYSGGPGTQGLVSGSVSVLADNVYAYPVLVSIPVTFVEAGLNVVSTGTATNARVGIYNSGSDKMPSSLLYSTSDLSVSTSGVKTQTGLSWIVAPGVYWFAIHADGSFNSSRALSSGERLLGSPSAGSLQSTGVVKGVTYSATPMPDPFGSSPSLSNSHKPAVLVRP